MGYMCGMGCSMLMRLASTAVRLSCHKHICVERLSSTIPAEKSGKWPESARTRGLKELVTIGKGRERQSHPADTADGRPGRVAPPRRPAQPEAAQNSCEGGLVTPFPCSGQAQEEL